MSDTNITNNNFSIGSKLFTMVKPEFMTKDKL